VRIPSPALEAHDLGQRLFDEVQQHLAAKGLKVATSTIVDATIINAPSFDQECRQGARSLDAPDEEGQPVVFRDEGAFRDRQPHQADPCGGGDAGQCCRQHGAAQLLHGQETRVWGDQAYRGQRPVIREHAPRAQDFTNRRYRHRGVVDEVERAKNRTKSKVRARVQHVIGVIKRVFGFAKVRYRGLKKNTHRLHVTCALANLFTGHRHLLRYQGA
jgi:IS5 family transposase